MKNIIFTVICSSVIVAVVVIFYMVRPCTRISCIEFQGKRELSLTDVYEEKPAAVFRGEYSFGEKLHTLRIDVRDAIDMAVGYDYIHGKIAGMKALYDNIKSPYPGLLSNEISCDDGYKPTYTSFLTSHGIEMYQINGYLNDRKVFGACTKDQIAYKVLRVLFQCTKEKQLIDMELIAPKDQFPEAQFAELVHSIDCR